MSNSAYYQKRKIKQTLGLPIEAGTPIINRITATKKLPPDKSNFITELKNGKGKTTCRKCHEVFLFDYPTSELYHVTEKRVRSDFKIFHSHEPDAPKVNESD